MNLVQRRKQMLEAAWSENAGGCVTLASLVAAMRRESQTTPGLSSIYFAGADVDHPYFLKTDALAIGMAVLPEDAEKARTRKRHPHQTEVMFILDGSLTLHREGEADLVLSRHEHFVIERNVCHWVTASEPAVFVFVKTNPAQQPRGVDCGPAAR